MLGMFVHFPPRFFLRYLHYTDLKIRCKKFSTHKFYQYTRGVYNVITYQEGKFIENDTGWHIGIWFVG